MRKVVAGLFITIDGVAESPDKWQEHFDEDMAATLEKHLATTDTIMLGRVTYEEWSEYWPNAEHDMDFGVHINNSPKYIVSDTLKAVRWGNFNNATLVNGADLAKTIADLKAQPGKNIAVSGSPTLVRSLIQQGLLDELQLIIHPVIVGKGKRLYEGMDELKRLKLVSSQTTRTGTVITTYEPVK